MSVTHQKISEFIQPLIDEYSKISIIDYGCGDGELLRYISPKKIMRYRGYDVNAKAIHQAKQNHTENTITFTKIKTNTLIQFGKKGSNHAVILIGVIQYLTDAELQNVFAEARRTLKPGGKLILSCAVDHPVYKILNLYRFFIPHQYIQRDEILRKIEISGLEVLQAKEKGLLFAPLFSNVFSLFFDGFDQIFFRTRGKIGPMGKFARFLVAPILTIEHTLPIDFGYTLYIVAKNS